MNSTTTTDLPRLHNRHLKDEAYRVIRDAIATLKFKPGAPVIEGALARSMGVSKTPVRNALIRLESEGLVQTLPFRGTFVAAVSTRDIRELYEVRAALEELAIAKVTALGPEAVASLRQPNEASVSHLETGDLAASFDSIREFHEGLVAMSGNRWLIDLYEDLSPHLTRIRNLCGMIPGRVRKSAREHEAVIVAMERGETGGAATALRSHLASLAADFEASAPEALRAATVREPAGVSAVGS